MVGQDAGRGNAAAPIPAASTAGPASRSGARRSVPLGIAALLLAAGVLIAVDTRGYKEGAGGEPGPAAIPMLVAAFCVVAAIALVIQTVRSSADGDGDGDGAGAGPVLPVRVIAAVASLTAAGFLLEQIGFFVTFTGLTFVAGLLAGARRWWTSLIVAVVTTWLVMIIFGRLFAVPLPASPIDVFLGG